MAAAIWAAKSGADVTILEHMDRVGKKIFDGFQKDDKVVVMTDVLSGSVNQKFIPYMGENVFLITGINVPLAMELVLRPEECINKEQLSQSIEMAKETIQFVNEINANIDDDDE